MKKTAVNWLYDEIKHIIPNSFLDKFEQAKAMEKEQIEEAHNEGQSNPYEYSEDNDVNWYDGKRYYNETYSK